MKNHVFFKRALISIMGLIIVLNCNAQTNKEKRAERNEIRKLQQMKNFETLGTMIQSRNFIFRSGSALSGKPQSLEIMINGSMVRISGLNSSEWSNNGSELKYSISKPASGKINDWELKENPEEPIYLISFIAQTTDYDNGVLIKIFSNKKAIAQFMGREYRGQVARN